MNKQRIPVKVTEEGLKFGKEKGGMLISFSKCTQNGDLQSGNFPLCKVSSVS